MQLSLFTSEEENATSVTVEELFHAYITCRRNKRNTVNALAFEADYEGKLVTLCEEINSGTYKPHKSIAFIVNKPVKREMLMHFTPNTQIGYIFQESKSLCLEIIRNEV